MNGTEALLALVAALDEASIPYMIVGSYSSNFYGIPRSTKDADLVLHLPSTGWAKLPSLLPAGIHMEEQMGFEMVTSTRKELLRVEGSLFEIELFHLSEDAHDQSRFTRRRRIEIFPGSFVWLPTPEDVVVQKLRWSKGAQRSKDFADAVAVLKVQGKFLDWTYIEDWSRRHGTLDLLSEAKTEASPAWEN